jgi:hypothetical protein
LNKKLALGICFLALLLVTSNAHAFWLAQQTEAVVDFREKQSQVKRQFTFSLGRYNFNAEKPEQTTMQLNSTEKVVLQDKQQRFSLTTLTCAKDAQGNYECKRQGGSLSVVLVPYQFTQKGVIFTLKVYDYSTMQYVQVGKILDIGAGLKKLWERIKETVFVSRKDFIDQARTQAAAVQRQYAPKKTVEYTLTIENTDAIKDERAQVNIFKRGIPGGEFEESGSISGASFGEGDWFSETNKLVLPMPKDGHFNYIIELRYTGRDSDRVQKYLFGLKVKSNGDVHFIPHEEALAGNLTGEPSSSTQKTISLPIPDAAPPIGEVEARDWIGLDFRKSIKGDVTIDKIKDGVEFFSDESRGPAYKIPITEKKVAGTVIYVKASELGLSRGVTKRIYLKITIKDSGDRTLVGQTVMRVTNLNPAEDLDELPKEAK